MEKLRSAIMLLREHFNNMTRCGNRIPNIDTYKTDDGHIAMSYIGIDGFTTKEYSDEDSAIRDLPRIFYEDFNKEMDVVKFYMMDMDII